jgi:hypothetical protein
VLTYLLGWSLVDDDGAPVPFSPMLPEAERLDAPFAASIRIGFDEIHAAIGSTKRRTPKKKSPVDRERIARDLAIARRCGWTYDYVRELDPDVYDVLVEQLNQEAADADQS